MESKVFKSKLNVVMDGLVELSNGDQIQTWFGQ